MITKGFQYLLCANLMFFSLPGSIKAQEFQRTYSLGAGAQIHISNVAGDITVAGYDGNTIKVEGFKEGSDRERVQIEDTSSADRLELKVLYPHNSDGSVDFKILVPKAIEYSFERISSVSGNVEMTEVMGSIKAESVSGNVSVRDVTGILNASTVSGNVIAEIAKLQGTGDMKFSSISGNVLVKAPADLDAAINMSSLSGSLKTDFPIEIQERRYGPGLSARGQLGSGSHNLRITSISGNVGLSRR